MSGRLKLKSIYPTFDDFKNYCQNVVGEFYPQIIDMVGFGGIVEEMNRYVYLPIYRQFKNATCRYLPTEEGIEAFNNQFANQLEEVVFDFLIYTSTNISYFNEAYNNVGQNLEQGVSTFNNPINQDIKNTKSNTVIADGATSQSINLMIYNGKTSWRKAFSSYYTPQRKAELIDRFRWLFISFYVGSDEGVTLVELSEALSMANGDMVITPEEAEILRKVIIEKPETLIPENIKKGVDIGGVIGTLEEGGIMKKTVFNISSSDISYNSGDTKININNQELSNFIINNDFKKVYKINIKIDWGVIDGVDLLTKMETISLNYMEISDGVEIAFKLNGLLMTGDIISLIEGEFSQDMVLNVVLTKTLGYVEGNCYIEVENASIAFNIISLIVATNAITIVEIFEE